MAMTIALKMGAEKPNASIKPARDVRCDGPESVR